jgi:hypothetical protein
MDDATWLLHASIFMTSMEYGVRYGNEGIFLLVTSRDTFSTPPRSFVLYENGRCISMTLAASTNS